MIRRKLFLRFIGLMVCVILVWIYLPSHVPMNYENLKHSERKSNSSAEKLFNFDLLINVIQSNDKQYNVTNEHRFSPLTDDNLVIVVQVHQRLKYLQNLIDSLSKVKSIEETLIIFSHDVIDEQINNSIRRIGFAKIKQIFFPFSTQIWYNTFPGQSVDDCPRDIGKKKALEINCVNAGQPDSYGHYREAKITQTKHHWWWKLWYVMEHLPQTRNHHGDFLFIEEDHYVSPDLIHHWKLMKLSQKDLKESDTVVDILTMGNYEFNVQKPINNVQAEMKKLNLTNWFSSKHNMAFTIDRALWSRIKSCQFAFCTFDDYNWDWSLQFIINECLKQKLCTLVTVVPSISYGNLWRPTP
ncbi:Alpha-1,6-mannosyl-glycoprotein 2-beta-N-acetylglucosaminyltransferase [Dermatophagoides farinae]|uniref:Alpha-1,6-mannosyl-glycoprotein 2-beta-N-acetylglucosaminyltransferase n=1 Tax=Dermatophagoides farinae TaxID=6954 RepID=A0A922LAF5_DERFA|nr:Alpha-1,6-mannosyl-glycoprotein 2-beta-N-acetylglucosaminyltransferase [Dermatophagoides farinae]